MNPRLLRAVGPATLAVVALAVMVVALAYGGGATPLVIGDAGPVVRWGLPAMTLATNLSAAGMVGSVVVALWALTPDEPAFEAALGMTSASAAVFTLAAGATGFLTFVDAFNAAITIGPEFGAQLGRFLTDTDLGRSWLLTTIFGAVVTVLSFAVRGWTGTFLVAIVAVTALVPVATQGHSGEEANHNAAVMATVLHVEGAALWLGGLILMVVVRPLLDRTRMANALSRYSTIALIGFVVVAGSGLVRAAIGVVTVDGLFSPYGAILMVKVVALLALGLFGAWYRLRLIGRLRESGAARSFWSLILAEIVFMGIASGAAVALSRTPPPVDTTLPELRTPAEFLTGAALPAELTPLRWITEWEIDVLWVFACAFGVFFYLAGVRRLRKRGDSWPLYRTILWVAGMAMLLWVTNGAHAVYQEYLFSVHMLGHMLLTMAIPLMLVAGAPVTLALRTIRKRDDGTRGGREWIMWALHTPFAKVITNPYFAAANFVLSLWLFYFTDLFRWSLYDHLGHEWMIFHFLVTGYLFVLSLIGIDPIPYRLPYPFRLLVLIGVMAMHAFFGIALMMNSGLMVAEWFGSMGRTWGATPLEDQYIGGGIAWSVGEIPTLILAITVAIQWSRSDERLQRRADRHADRTADAELEEYNAKLARLAERDARAGR
ncbi:cytochrome c oxidase assembly protein [Microbacterium sediminicola]|uniref:Cytochrome c oxidase assembly protein n=1 Tax=Microbacterium sediminicola TaxID=415210 RepID=A0ABN2ICI8_9MICO